MANREILTILREYRTVGCGESQTGAARRGYYPVFGHELGIP